MRQQATYRRIKRQQVYRLGLICWLVVLALLCSTLPDQRMPPIQAAHLATPVMSNTPTSSTTAKTNALAWGYNYHGELGNGTQVDSSVPVAVITSTLPPDVTFSQITAGNGHSLGLGSDGKAYAWGFNNYGQLGNDTITSSNVPVAVTMPDGVTFSQIAAGSGHNLGLGSDGKAYAWGYNEYGQLGNGYNMGSYVPIAVTMPDGVTFSQIAVGSEHSLGLGSDGKTYAWGWNDAGQLGNGTSGYGTDSNVPIAVMMPPGVTFSQIAAGYGHSLGLGSDGKLYAWGYNESGQLGNGTTRTSKVPIAVKMPDGVTFSQIAAGALHSLGLGSDGKAYAWGSNSNGQLGNGTTYPISNVPVAIKMPPGVTFSQLVAGSGYSSGLGNDGKAYTWGYNFEGQLGNGTSGYGTDSNVPVAVTMPDGVTFSQITSGFNHSLGLGSDGKAYAWGFNFHGQLGNGSVWQSTVPVTVLAGSMPNGVTFSRMSAGGGHSLGLGSDGKLYAWGTNSGGQLGNGTNTNSNMPVAVHLPPGVTFSRMSAGSGHSLGIGSDNQTYAWGWNDAGQLGNGSYIFRNVPVAVKMPPGVTFSRVAAGERHNLSIGSDGKLYAWGNNFEGQLGNGTSGYGINSNVPVAVKMPPGVTFSQISAGSNHSLGLGSDGKAYAWGFNSTGQLGNGTNTSSNVPVAVKMPPGVIFSRIAAGGDHNLGLGSDGKVYAWGLNFDGQLGNGTSSFGANSNVPVAVKMPPGVTFSQISAGFKHSLGLGSDGKVYTWGANDYGQLGNGANGPFTNSNVPVAMKMPSDFAVTRLSDSSTSLHNVVIGQTKCLEVTAITDNGAGTDCGTFSYALATATAGDTITFTLTTGSTITFSDPLTITVPAGVTIDGSTNPTGEIILDGNGVSGDGLVLGGQNTLRKLTIANFGGRALKIRLGSTGNILDHIKILQTLGGGIP